MDNFSTASHLWPHHLLQISHNIEFSQFQSFYVIVLLSVDIIITLSKHTT